MEEERRFHYKRGEILNFCDELIIYPDSNKGVFLLQNGETLDFEIIV